MSATRGVTVAEGEEQLHSTLDDWRYATRTEVCGLFSAAAGKDLECLSGVHEGIESGPGLAPVSLLGTTTTPPAVPGVRGFLIADVGAVGLVIIWDNERVSAFTTWSVSPQHLSIPDFACAILLVRPVPELATALLVAMGLATLGGLRRSSGETLGTGVRNE